MSAGSSASAIRFGDAGARDIERTFFGTIDARGKRAVEFFAKYRHQAIDERALDDLVRYMSVQKLAHA